MTSCVWVTSATSFPASDRMVVWQTTVVRPLCTGTDSPTTRVPRGAPPMKLVFDSIVVVRAPCGMLRIAATAPSVSANAMMAPPCRLSPRVHRSLRTASCAITLSGVTSVKLIPINSGSRPLTRSWIDAARFMPGRGSVDRAPFALGGFLRLDAGQLELHVPIALLHRRLQQAAHRVQQQRIQGQCHL